MKKYLLDSNICIYFMNGKFDIHHKIKKVGEENCFISEITVAELKYGVEKSSTNYISENRANMEKFQRKFEIIPIFSSLDVYAKEKSRLKKAGTILDDFDLLIGATAISNKYILVTQNVHDFERLHNIAIEDWTK